MVNCHVGRFYLFDSHRVRTAARYTNSGRSCCKTGTVNGEFAQIGIVVFYSSGATALRQSASALHTGLIEKSIRGVGDVHGISAVLVLHIVFYGRSRLVPSVVRINNVVGHQYQPVE